MRQLIIDDDKNKERQKNKEVPSHKCQDYFSLPLGPKKMLSVPSCAIKKLSMAHMGNLNPQML